MKGYFSAISRGVLLNSAIQLVQHVGLVFAFLYFQNQGLEFYKIFSIWWIAPLTALPVLYFMKEWPMKRQMMIGALMYPTMLLTLIFYSDISFIIYGIANGLALALFWVSLNVVFFQGTDKSRGATDFSVYFIIGPIFGILLPPLGALVIDAWSYTALFGASLLLSILPLYVLSKTSFDKQPKLTFSESSKAIEGVRLLQGLNMALHFFFVNFIPIYLLYFISTEYEVGAAAGGIAFLGLIVSIFVAKLSDKKEDRARIVTPILMGMSALMLLIPQIESLFLLTICITALLIINGLSMPIRFANIIDNVDRHIGVWRAMEFYGDIARTIAFLLTAITIYFNLIWVAFAIFSASCLLLAIINSKNANKQKLMRGNAL